MIREGGDMGHGLNQLHKVLFVRVKILNVYAMCSLGRWEGMMDEREGGAGGLNQFHKVQTFRFLYSQNVHFVQFETPTV